MLKNSLISNSSKSLKFSFLAPNELVQATSWARQLEIAAFDVKPTILFHSNQPAILLAFEDLPQNLCHQGVEYLRALILQRYFVVRLRTTITSIESNCLTRHNAKAHVVTPIMADLNWDNLALPLSPSTTPGLTSSDLFTCPSTGRENRWGIPFKCLITQTVQLKVLSLLDTNSYVKRIEVSQRGVLSVLRSDKETNFITSQAELLRKIAKHL